MAASAVVRSITLLSALSLTSFYIGYITSSASGHRASTSTSDGRRLHENADPIANRIQKCYNYNYFSEACIHDNHEVHRLLDGVLHPKSRSKDSNQLQRSSSGVKVGDVSGSFLTGSVAISKQDLMDRFDKFGVATLLSDTAENALLLYNSFNSLPSNDPNYVTHQQFATSYANVTQALENCEALNVQFVHNPSSSVLPMCNLYIPGLNNIPSFHIQRWMRQDEELRHVGSLTTPSGVDKFDLPKYHPVIFKHWEALRTFLENVDRVLDEVDSIIKERFEKLGIPDKTLIVMTINMGDADLLINFLCAAKSRNLDTRRILVFVTDDESKKLIESLAGDEIMVYHDKYNLASVKKGGGSQKFGDATFVSMMFVKILCVLYPSLLGYDVLYQDADIIWYQDPLDFFRGRHPESSERLKEYDVIFQVRHFNCFKLNLSLWHLTKLQSFNKSMMGHHNHGLHHIQPTLAFTTLGPILLLSISFLLYFIMEI
jgi:hypothetical protein